MTAAATRLPRGLAIPPGPDGVRALLEALPLALEGGDAIAVHATGDSAHHRAVIDALGIGPGSPALEYDDVAIILATSGSTGDPRGVMHTAESILAAARGQLAMPGFERPAAWLCAIPVTSAGGFQVVLRAWLAGVCEPEAVPSVGRGFDIGEIVNATQRLASRCGGAPMLTSLVPTQVSRCLDDPRATEALAAYDAILCGGAATPPRLVTAAASCGIRLVTTYGMTETGGGVVYGGLPFPGVSVTTSADGELLITGEVVARGYRLRPDETSERFDGSTFRTRDVGSVVDGQVTVDGRIDDIVQVRGTNVSLRAVDEVLSAVDGVLAAAVIAVPDDVDGSRLVAFIEGDVNEAVAKAIVRDVLGSAAVPAEFRGVSALPLLPNGKIDRRALIARA